MRLSIGVDSYGRTSYSRFAASTCLAWTPNDSQGSIRGTADTSSPVRPAREFTQSHRSVERAVRKLLARLTGKPVDETVTLFPPFTADLGKNITLGKRVFINSGCRFQDQGCITLGDDCLIGHNAVIATLQHDIDPRRRSNLIPSPVVIERNVWLGANVTVLPGVTIGEDAVIGAGSIVTKTIPAGTIAVGSPARVVRTIDE